MLKESNDCKFDVIHNGNSSYKVISKWNFAENHYNISIIRTTPCGGETLIKQTSTYDEKNRDVFIKHYREHGREYIKDYESKERYNESYTL